MSKLYMWWNSVMHWGKLTGFGLICDSAHEKFDVWNGAKWSKLHESRMLANQFDFKTLSSIANMKTITNGFYFNYYGILHLQRGKFWHTSKEETNKCRKNQMPRAEIEAIHLWRRKIVRNMPGYHTLWSYSFLPRLYCGIFYSLRFSFIL